MRSLLEYGHSKLDENKSVSNEIEKQIWGDRLEKRLSDLELSHTILMQTQKQVDLLMMNDLYLVDKILAILGTTIPIWRMQVALLLGMEKTNEQVLVQNKIAMATETYVKENGRILKREIRKAKPPKDIDVEEIKKLNDSFLREIDNLSVIENENDQIVTDTKQLLLKA